MVAQHLKVERRLLLLTKASVPRSHYGLGIKLRALSLATANALDKIELKAIYKAMGTSGFLYTISYDGKTFHEFSPHNLSFQIQDTKNVQIQFTDCPLFPMYWTHMGANTSQLHKK